MKKSRPCKNRFKKAMLNRQSEAIQKSGQISPLSWLIIENLKSKLPVVIEVEYLHYGQF